ncbi:prolyl-tRNA synthetase [Cryobacterium roopkundense]|uniref:Prolyl-tRNA editing enzyme YbaK/EbsC (Cys-tRNA(Pro) deacylase) n=1 Tax=Cryobacterium roopkundense TaxID=1001240 RepID=A0A099JT14_9MICO|nr:YbaK/EbsC family protein [Cryobacterium roopkundense]KGJ80777.1 prolyl-tRNA synthetase [Cryobacterium roopkundense]MBB5639669.1 prolyl-tRNA editing enzyme YbaK/EbsC (Cys-tRNA(Pro) deacylase) [Cryobacterium roopkundense]
MVNLTHPAVDRVREALQLHGLDPEIRWFDDAATTAVAAAAALGIPVGAIANSLVFTFTAPGQEPQPLLVLTSGAHRVDQAWLGTRLGGLVGRASKELVKEATGQVIGGVAPLGHPLPLRTVVDEALAEFPVVWAAAGHAHTVFPTSYRELLRITGGEPGAVSAPTPGV